MKPFDLEAAKRGEPVCTADGCEVRLYAFDAPTIWGGVSQPIVGVAKNKEDYWFVTIWMADGRYWVKEKSTYDLRMAPRKKKWYIVSFLNGTQFGVHPTECSKKAESLAREYRTNGYTNVEITEKEVTI